jgi:PAS domain-containing protein
MRIFNTPLLYSLGLLMTPPNAFLGAGLGGLLGNWLIVRRPMWRAAFAGVLNAVSAVIPSILVWGWLVHHTTIAFAMILSPMPAVALAYTVNSVLIAALNHFRYDFSFWGECRSAMTENLGDQGLDAYFIFPIALLAAVLPRPWWPALFLVGLAVSWVNAVYMLAQTRRQDEGAARVAAQTVPADDPRLRQVAENLGQGVALTTVDGTILGMTEPAMRTFGRSVLPANAQLTDLCMPDDAARVTRAIALVCRTSTETTTDVRVIDASGGRRWLRLGFVNRLHDVSVRRVVVTVRDVTEATAPWQQLRGYADRLLTGRLFAAQERELARVAREIEDKFRQVLAVMRHNLGSMRAAVRGQPSAHTVDQIVAITDDTAQSMQGLIDGMQRAAATLQRELQPPALADLGLVAALQVYCADADLPSARIAFHSEVPETRRFRRDVELSAYRIVHDVLSAIPENGARVFGRVSVAVQNGGLRVVIEHTGEPPPEEAGPADRSLLTMLQERAKVVGGSVAREAAADGCVRFVVTLPADEER